MSQSNQRLIGASLVALILGVFIGMFVDSVFPGTAGDNDDNAGTNVEDASTLYYEVAIEDASDWLATTYPSIQTDVETVEQNLLLLNENPLVDPRQVARTELDAETNAILIWTQAALDGLPADRIVGLDGAATEIELSKDPLITACLGVNDDPFAITAATEESGIVIYLEVPVGEEKNVPKDWEAIEQKSPTDIFWIPVLCSPVAEAETE